MKKILFVCLGNICRSPLAEAIFNHKVNSLGLQHQFIGDSCGTSNYHIGDEPDHRTIKCSLKNGVPIRHAARQLSRADLEEFDLVLAMDKNNFQHIHSLALPAHTIKIKMMRDYDPHGNGDVPDPYYGGDPEFQEVFDILHRSMDNLMRELTFSVPDQKLQR